MKRYLKVLYISLGLGLVAASIVLFIGFQHNPQGTFIDINTGEADILYIFSIFISWFILSSIMFGIIGSVITFLASILTRMIKGN
ncbi:MAG: hypothetical protein WB502_16460 [Thermoactinomyces sp.]